MCVQIQETPNPNAHKYVLPGVQFSSSLNASTPAEASAHPLASSLLALDAVYNVFLARDFVTVNKVTEASWELLDREVERILSDFLTSLDRQNL